MLGVELGLLEGVAVGSPVGLLVGLAVGLGVGSGCDRIMVQGNQQFKGKIKSENNFLAWSKKNPAQS